MKRLFHLVKRPLLFLFLSLLVVFLLLLGPIGWLVLFLSRQSSFWQLNRG